MSKQDELLLRKVEIKYNNLEFKCEGYTAEEVNSIFNTVSGGACPTPEFPKMETVLEKPKAERHIRKEEDVEEYNIKDVMKGAKLPRVTTDFMCTGCEQSLIFINETDQTFLVRDLKDNTLHRTEAIIDSLPAELYEDGVINYDLAIDIYNDMIKYALPESLTLISDSNDIISCPFCHTKMTIKEAVKKFEEMSNEEKCPICGGEVERTISQEGEKTICKEHDCLNKIKF